MPNVRPSCRGALAPALLVSLLPFASLGCGPSAEEARAEPVTAPARLEDAPLVVFLGDSLTAGFGLPEEQAFPALLEARAALAGRPFRAINAGVSGDTSRGGLARLDWLLRQRPDIVVVGLGANDGLRGLPLEQLEANLRAILTKARDSGADVLLLGQRVPPSLGDFARDFASVYARVAEDSGVDFVPFLLEGVGGDRSMNLGDGIHPNRRGQERLADNVWPKLSRMLERLEQ